MHKHNQPLDIDQVYALMMDALDGPLASDDQVKLDSALEANPELAAEWQAMLMVDDLLMQTPMVEPPANFAVHTIARLPNWRARRWAVVMAFMASLSVGMFPLIILGIGVLLGADMGIAATGLIQILSAVASGLGQIVIEAASMMTGYPAVMGMLLVMVGSITLWSGLYQQLVVRPMALTN